MGPPWLFGRQGIRMVICGGTASFSGGHRRRSNLIWGVSGTFSSGVADGGLLRWFVGEMAP